MKSYFLEAIVDADQARQRLTEQLPSQTEPWVFLSHDGMIRWLISIFVQTQSPMSMGHSMSKLMLVDAITTKISR